uniref:Probable 2-phosphosulfolactate phosphatase n=1 Tax=Candidatus Nitrotoga fabula TaxID=2182327 RepID=A0A2X0QTX5_9PROT|nr:putative 2-phosphosulfolactate phosphatase [Candidatus Nitrotoga fabula]
MEIEIVDGLPSNLTQNEAVVLIDVFRASSTIVSLVAAGIMDILISDAHDKIKEYVDDATTVVLSEIDSELNTSDNSPVFAFTVDPSYVNRAIIISQNGTQCIKIIDDCYVLIVCAFLNIDAVAAYLRSLAPRKIVICAIGHISKREAAPEDRLCAEMLSKRIRNEYVDEPFFRKHLMHRVKEVRKDQSAPQGRTVELDRLFSLSIGIFDVVPIVAKNEEKYAIYDAAADTLDLDYFISSPSFTTEYAYELGVMLQELHELSTTEPMHQVTPRNYYATDEYNNTKEFRIAGERDFVNLLISNERYLVHFAPSIGRFFPSREQYFFGPSSLDLAAIYSRLIISGNGSVQRTHNLCTAFFKGYGRDVKEKDIIKLARNLLIERLVARKNLTQYFVESVQNLVERLHNFVLEDEVGLTAFHKAICDLSDNRGKLEGVVLSQEQIVYQKRDGSEFSINFTNRCPNSCSFCIRDFDAGWVGAGKTNKDNNLYLLNDPTDEEIIDAIASALDERGGFVELIKFCGYGEPMMRPQSIIRISKYIKNLDPAIRIQVNTSGWPYYRSYCTEYELEDFKEAGVDVFSVSMNASTKELYDKLTRPGVYDLDESAYDDTLRFIKATVKAGFQVKTSVVRVPKITDEEEKACEQKMEALGATFVSRPFIGRSCDERKVGVEVETKLFGVDRDKVIKLLKIKEGSKQVLTGVTTIINYDLPKDAESRAKILAFLETNPPELRRFHALLKEVVGALKTGLTLYDSLGFLRIKVEQENCQLIYKCPSRIGPRTKRETEYSFNIDSVKHGEAIMKIIGLEETRILQKNRESFYYSGVYFHVDTWPGVPTYLEVEGFDDVAIHSALQRVGIDPKGMTGKHAETVFIENNVDPSNLRFSESQKAKLGIS